MRHCFFATSRGIVDTQGHTALINTVEAIIRPCARPDRFFASLLDFAYDMRIRHMCSGHADHVQMTGRNGISRGCHVLDARRVEGRQSGCPANFACNVQMRRTGHSRNRDHFSHCRICMDATTINVKKINHAAVAQLCCNLDPFVGSNAAFLHLIHRPAHTNNKIRSSPFTNSTKHVEAKTHAVFERIRAIRAIQCVG